LFILEKYVDLRTAILEMFKLETSAVLLSVPDRCDKKRSKMAVDHKGHLVQVHYRTRKKSVQSTQELPS